MSECRTDATAKHQALELLREHPQLSRAEVARTVGVSRQTVCNWTHAEGIELQPQGLTDEQQEAIVRVVVERPNLTYRAIARHFGIGERSLECYLEKAGVRRNKKPGAYWIACDRCKHPQHAKCSQYWCACEHDVDVTEEPQSRPEQVSGGVRAGRLVLPLGRPTDRY